MTWNPSPIEHETTGINQHRSSEISKKGQQTTTEAEKNIALQEREAGGVKGFGAYSDWYGGGAKSEGSGGAAGTNQELRAHRKKVKKTGVMDTGDYLPEGHKLWVERIASETTLGRTVKQYQESGVTKTGDGPKKKGGKPRKWSPGGLRKWVGELIAKKKEGGVNGG